MTRRTRRILWKAESTSASTIMAADESSSITIEAAEFSRMQVNPITVIRPNPFLTLQGVVVQCGLMLIGLCIKPI